MGWESGLDHKYGEAKQFYLLYTALIVIGGLISLLPNLPLIEVMFLSQVVNGIMLPFTLIPMLLIVNNKKLMGAYVNSRTYNIFSWAFVIVISGMSLVWLVLQFSGTE